MKNKRILKIFLFSILIVASLVTYLSYGVKEKTTTSSLNLENNKSDFTNILIEKSIMLDVKIQRRKGDYDLFNHYVSGDIDGEINDGYSLKSAFKDFIMYLEDNNSRESRGIQYYVYDKSDEKICFTNSKKNLRKAFESNVQQIPIDALHPFTNHPFKVLDDEAMTRTVESIAQYGVLAPLIARPRPDGDGYEIISGHRRQYAAKLAGLDTLPVIVRQMSDDAAVILMVDSNLQREHILPSERAFAYKMKLDAIKNQGARSDLTSAQVAQKLSVEKVGDDAGVSKDTIRRFIRLTNLIPELLDMVDEKKISFNPAVELSYLDESQQRDFLEAMDGTQNAPSVSQAQQLKKMAQCGEFTYEKAFDILGQEKKSEQDTVTIKNDILRKYFPRNYTPRQMEEKIIQLLDAWQKKQQRRNER